MSTNSDFLDFLNQEKKSHSEQISMTIRVTQEDDAKIKDLADYADITRQELIYEAIKKYVLPAWDELYKNELSDIDLDSEKESNKSYYLLNTNKGNDIEDHRRMLRDGVAAAFEDGYKEKIDKIKTGSTVFLYESGRGIVAYGQADKEVKVEAHNGRPGKTHLRRLNQFTLLKTPISSKDINKILERKLIPVQALIRLKDGERLFGAIKKYL